MPHLIGRQSSFGGDLRQRRIAAKRSLQRSPRRADAIQVLDDVRRQANGPASVDDRPRDRLSNPPGRIRRELEAAAILELVDRLHQTEIAFLNQIEEWQVRVLVALRDRHYEP